MHGWPTIKRQHLRQNGGIVYVHVGGCLTWGHSVAQESGVIQSFHPIVHQWMGISVHLPLASGLPVYSDVRRTMLVFLRPSHSPFWLLSDPCSVCPLSIYFPRGVVRLFVCACVYFVRADNCCLSVGWLVEQMVECLHFRVSGHDCSFLTTCGAHLFAFLQGRGEKREGKRRE